MCIRSRHRLQTYHRLLSLCRECVRSGYCSWVRCALLRRRGCVRPWQRSLVEYIELLQHRWCICSCWFCLVFDTFKCCFKRTFFPSIEYLLCLHLLLLNSAQNCTSYMWISRMWVPFPRQTAAKIPATFYHSICTSGAIFRSCWLFSGGVSNNNAP